MAITSNFIRERNFLLTTYTNGADDKQLFEHVQRITEETKDMHPLLTLSDLTKITDYSGFTEAGLASAGTLEQERPHKQDKLAVLVPEIEEVHRLATFYTGTSRYYRYDVQFFYDFTEAIEWLGVEDLLEEISKMRLDNI